MGTNRRLLISIGGFLLLLTCIHAHGQKNLSEEDWDSVDQDYADIDVENYESDEIQQTVGEDEEDMQQQSNGNPSRVNIIASPAPVYRSQNPSHNQKICSTFGNYNFKTFDGDIFHFPGHCSYQLVRHCKTNYEEFFVGLTREVRKNIPVISGIHMKLDGADIFLGEKTVIVNSISVEELPFSIGGTLISKSGTYMRITSKIGFDMYWNEEDSVTVELSIKYANQTCGLCGDYNGIPIYNEFIINNAHLTNIQYGNLQKYNLPEEEKCEDTTEEEETTCPQSKHLCRSVLTGAAFQECNKIVEVQKYIELCEQDICRCKGNSTGFCLCNIFTEYSRQCTHAGGKPKNWRTSKMCPLRCAFNLQFSECGTACPDTCSNPERSLVCDDHCTDGCICPAGMVFDDIRKTGCIRKEECPCTHNGEVYPSRKGYSEKCQDCTCKGGKWNCVRKECQGFCAVEGGSHITTFDLTRYNFHGDCTYTLAKSLDSSLFSILVDINKCGHTDTQTCLRGISLSMYGGNEFIFVKKCGSVYINSVYSQLPVSTASVTIFQPTSFYMIMQTKIGIQIKIQLVPTMQVFVAMDPKYMNKISGLCGNFNDIQTDDFKSPAGVIEGTGSSFGNLWKIQLDCPNVKNNFEDPCALLGQNEQYASHHCDLLLASDGPFASCHKTVDPESYHKNCMFDACNCENKEDCMCSALSSYVTACARQGVDLRGWRTNICHSYTATCQPAHAYSYTVSTCTPSCRSLSEPDITCEYDIGTIDGCICEDGTYRDDSGGCVLPALCSCYYKGTAVSPGEVIHENGAMCTCTNGKLECIGVTPVEQKVCEHQMVYFDCDNATVGTKGSECQKSCSTFDNDCYSSGCVSGCVCPEGLVRDDERNICVAEEDCPCTLNNDYYAAGETVQVKCNTCTCKQRKWECTKNTCLGTCGAYGDGHYLTFDDRRYRFNGNCWYTLAQDYCSNDPSEGTFRVLTENIPCGSQGTTCSKSIRIMLGNYEMVLGDQKFDVVKRNTGHYVPFNVRQMGIYMVVEAANGLALVWDKKTSIFIKLDPKFEGKVCGLCGNFDGNAANDYITRSQSVVGDILEFGNSWKLSQRCPNAVEIADTCASNPYRKAWSQKQCSIITSGVFASCHGLVDPVKYHEACVNDACACDSGGDCDCFCTAVAAYAQACSEAGQCIKWRSPNICPVFCDFYNQQGHCEWHYQACGAPCLKTCMNPTGTCFNKLIGLEGCYPTCPEDRPFFDEESMRCVASCNCYDEYGEEYKPGEKMPGATRCSLCTCTKNGRECSKSPACCIYEGKEFLPGDIVYYTADGIGGCLNAICSDNSTIERRVGICQTTAAPSTTFNFSASTSTEESSTSHEGSPTPSTPIKSSPGTTSAGKSTEQPPTSTSSPKTPTTSSGASPTATEVPTVSPTACVEAYECTWSEWYDVSKPENGEGDLETFENIESQGHKVCKNPSKVECRAKEYPNYALKDLGQDVTCSRQIGLVCLNIKNTPLCHNFEMRIECCKYRECTTTPTSISVEHSSTSNETSSPTSSSVEIQTQSPTTKEKPTSLPVKVTSQTPISTSAATSETTESSETVTISSETTASETSTTEGSTSSAIVSTSGESTPQKPETSKSPSTTSTGSSETSSQVTEKTSSSEETPKTSAPSPTTSCVYKMECRWTQWYDNNAPNTRSDGGDTESIDDIKSTGEQICTNHEVENKIQCQAVDNKGLAIADNNQKYSCNMTSGVRCYNREQKSKVKCHNYQFQIECCQKVCESVQTPEITTTEITEPETTSGKTTTQGTTGPGSEPSQQVSTRPPSSTLSTPLSTKEPSIPTTSHEVIPSQSTICVYKMECRWTEWFDYNKPSTKSDGGDTESIADIKSRGTEVCKSMEVEDKIECQAVDNKGVPIIDNSQKFNCSLKDGVICQNRDQTKKDKCRNYMIRVLCCAEVCEPVLTPVISTIKTSEATTISSATSQPTPGSTSMSATEKPEISTPSEGTSPLLTSPEVITPSTSTKATCIPKLYCRWTPWYNLNKPTRQSGGGERESPEDIKSKGHEICKVQEFENKIECEAVDLEGVTIADNHQIVTCTMETGLTCMHRSQKDKDKCKDYRIRVQCCASYCEPVVASTTPSPVGTQSSSPTTSSITEPTLSSPSKTVTGTKRPDTSSEITPGSSTEKPSSPTEVTSATSSPTTGCVKKMECRWTSWFDISSDNPKGDGGETENAEDTKAQGLQICKQNEVEHNIECEALDKDGTTITNNQQVMSCDLKNGLSCLNKKQKKEECKYDRVRFECCAEYCEKTETPTTTLATTSVTQTSSVESSPPGSPETSSPGNTKSPTSSTGVTSAPTTTSSTTQTESATSGETPSSQGPEETSQPPGTPPKGTTPGQPSTSEKPTSGETPSSQGPEETSQPPGTPPKGTTPGQPSTSEKPTSGETPSSQGPEETSQPPGTPPKGTTPGQPSTSEKPTTGETPSSQGPEETSQPPGTPPKGTTPGQPSTSEKPTSGETPSSQGPEETSQPPGTPPKGTTPGQPSTSEKPTSGETPSSQGPEETSQPPGTPSKGTTPGKPSTSAETPPSGSPHYPTSPSSCEELKNKKCRWTQWFNTGKPSSETGGEDKENVENLEARGIEVCKKDEIVNNIKCKAETYQGSYQNVEQVVTCNVKDGLICRNDEQADEAKQCLDYAMQIECCSKMFVEQCGQPTTAPASTTSPETPSRETTGTPNTSTSVSSTTSSPVTVTSTSGTTAHPTGSSPSTTLSATSSGGTEVLTTTVTPEQSTSPTSETSMSHPDTTPNCFCKVNEKMFSPGESIYTKQDNEGCKFHAVCGSTCQIEYSVGECSTTAATPTKPGTPTEPGTPTSTEKTSIKDVTSEKPTFTRPSKRPSTGGNGSTSTATEPSTSTELDTSTEPGTSTKPGTSTEPGTPTEQGTPTSAEKTSIKDVTSEKPTLTRPSKRPTGGTGSTSTSTESSTSSEPGTSTEPGKPTEPGTSTEPGKPTEQGTSTEPGKPTEPGTSTEPGKPTESTCGPCECLMPNCGTGYRVVSHRPPGACCATITCEPDSVCVADNTIYKPGSIIPQAKDACQKCECSKDEKDETGFYAVTCQELVCDSTCEKGFEYIEKEGECCGECVPKQCTMKKVKVESGETVESGQKGESGEKKEEDTQIMIQIGDIYRPEDSTCVYYECDEEDGKPILTKVKKVCQELDFSKCEEGTVKYDEDGCCQTCTPKTELQVVEKPVIEDCSSRKNVTILREDDCKIEVELTYCGGPCMGTSIYSAESQGMDHKCSCCTELEVTERQVELLCANGQRKTHYYKDVVRCGCSVATCEPLSSGEHQEAQQHQQRYQSSSRRRRR